MCPFLNTGPFFLSFIICVMSWHKIHPSASSVLTNFMFLLPVLSLIPYCFSKHNDWYKYSRRSMPCKAFSFCDLVTEISSNMVYYKKKPKGRSAYVIYKNYTGRSKKTDG